MFRSFRLFNYINHYFLFCFYCALIVGCTRRETSKDGFELEKFLKSKNSFKNKNHLCNKNRYQPYPSVSKNVEPLITESSVNEEPSCSYSNREPINSEHEKANMSKEQINEIFHNSLSKMEESKSSFYSFYNTHDYPSETLEEETQICKQGESDEIYNFPLDNECFEYIMNDISMSGEDSLMDTIDITDILYFNLNKEEGSTVNMFQEKNYMPPEIELHNTSFMDTIFNDNVFDDIMINDFLINKSQIEETISNQTISNETISNETISDETISNQAISNETISDETVSNETISYETISNETISYETISDETISDETISYETISDGTISSETISDESSSTKKINKNAKKKEKKNEKKQEKNNVKRQEKKSEKKNEKKNAMKKGKKRQDLKELGNSQSSSSNLCLQKHVQIENDEEKEKAIYKLFQEKEKSVQSDYILALTTVGPHIAEINAFIKNVNISNDLLVTNFLKNLRKSYRFILKLIDYPLCIYQINVAVMPLVLFSVKIENMKSYTFPLDKSNCDVFNIIESKVCLQAYLEVLQNYSKKCLATQFNVLKKESDKQKVSLEKFPEKGESLTHDVTELKHLFKELLVQIQKNSTMYKMQNFYKITFQLQNKSSDMTKEQIFPSVPNLMNNIYNIMEKVKSENSAFFSDNIIDVSKGINQYTEEEEKGEGSIYLITKVVEKLRKTKNDLKNKIKEYLGENLRIGNYFIYYHFSLLMLYRILAMRSRPNELKQSVLVYKTFLNMFDQIYPNQGMLNYSNLNAHERDIIFNKEEAMYHIVEYIKLHMVEIILSDTKKNLTKYIGWLKYHFHNRILYLERKKFLMEQEFREKAFATLVQLIQIFETIYNNKCRVMHFMKVCIVVDTINCKVDEILSLLKIITGNKTDDKTQTTIINILDNIKSLHDIFSYIINK